MADTKDQLAEIEELIKVFKEGNIDTYALKQKKQGFLLGTISQLKEEMRFLNGYFPTDRNARNKLSKITADLNFYENKLKELKE
jgi:hypothetical protein